AVIGVDSSFPQLKAAKDRGLNVAVMDGHQLSFRRQFDAVFTNAALHWMKQPEAVVAGVGKFFYRAGGSALGIGGEGKRGENPLRSSCRAPKARHRSDAYRPVVLPIAGRKFRVAFKGRVHSQLHRPYPPTD